MLRRFTFLFAPFALLGCSAGNVTDVTPGLWVVRDADTTVYLFPTLDILTPGKRWYGGRIRTALEASDQVVVDRGNLAGVEAAEAITTLLHKPGPGVGAQVQPETMRALDRLIHAHGFEQWRSIAAVPAWRVAVGLEGRQNAAMRYQTQHGVAPLVRTLAAANHKPLVTLETANQYFGQLAALPDVAQEAYLRRRLDAMPTWSERMLARSKAWGSGDPADAADALRTPGDTTPELEALIKTRSQRWAGWIADRLQRPGTVFFAVDTDYFDRTRGMMPALAQRGLKVERVQ